MWISYRKGNCYGNSMSYCVHEYKECVAKDNITSSQPNFDPAPPDGEPHGPKFGAGGTPLHRVDHQVHCEGQDNGDTDPGPSPEVDANESSFEANMRPTRLLHHRGVGQGIHTSGHQVFLDDIICCSFLVAFIFL